MDRLRHKTNNTQIWNMHQNSLKVLLRQSAGLYHQNFLLCGSRSASEFTSLISFLGMLLMLAQEPYFQKHFFFYGLVPLYVSDLVPQTLPLCD